ncbi:MFS transporter [Bosea sp. (in: a-proteobacteria)]|uniref:MFS transporter n=1 Tax=Bosea sp. (in: a-proteobacteria) TaxID=1871050 RepID=UPI00262A5211|nr:MFS transporter [Bosea sp. (in: a-proteobacteria)]MCO5093083.1 MFS transporter [Bosea sp. (in: a-proteobacteria)]
MSEPVRAPAESLTTLVVILGLCGFSSAFTMRLIDPLVPTLAGEFGESIPRIALLVTAFSGFYALGQPFLGPIADSVGKLRSITACLVALCLFSLLAVFATGFWSLLILRAASGIVAGGVNPAALATIGDRAPMSERQIMLSRYLVIMIVGQMAGATFSGVIADHIGWRAVMGVAALLAAGGALLVRLTLKPRPDPARAPLSLAGALAGYRAVFSNPSSKLIYALIMIEGTLAFGVQPFIAAILDERSGVGASEAGLVIGAMGLGGVVYGVLIRPLVERIGPRQMIRLGGLTVAAGYFAFMLPGPWWSAVGIFLIMGFGLFLLHGTFQAQATELAPTARGSAMALFACFFFMGHASGPLVMGPLLQALGPQAALAIFGVAVGVLGLVAPRLLRLGAPG